MLRLELQPAEHRICTVLEADPAASISTITRETSVSRGIASKLRVIIAAANGGKRLMLAGS